jgi:TolB-like protein/tetratricopeptide (TPR) repeat protein
MLHKRTFLVPVVIDGTPERGAAVPDRFNEVQWTRVPGGETPPAFVERIRRLLAPDAPPTTPTASAGAAGGPVTAPSVRRSPLPKPAIGIAAAIVALFCAYFVADKFWLSKYSFTHTPAAAPGAQQTAPSAGTAAAFNPPPHSIAVLPFVNLSGDARQDYFSDGLTEELLNSLAQINDLQVAARTSSFSFKEHPSIVTVAHELNVATVLEGSVRRSAHTVRITAQLINAVTGFHLWSKTYDRDLGDVLKLQTEIATAVADSLKVTLIGNVSERIELGGTRNPAAFDAYLRGLRLMRVATTRDEARLTLGAYTEAIGLDPKYALAYAARSLALSDYIVQSAPLEVRRESPQKARADAERAIALAPELGAAHAALARFLETFSLDYRGAWEEAQKALALAPGNAAVLYEYSQHAALMGRADEAIDAAKRGVMLDPLNVSSHRALGDALWIARRYDEALAAYQDAITADRASPEAYARRGLVYYMMGDYQGARSACEVKPDFWESNVCLALSYEKLGLSSKSEVEVHKLVDYGGDAFAYQYAQISAQRGDQNRAVEWMNAAWRLRDPGFRRLKTDPLLDPLRKEPRFQAIERELKFPN